VREQNGPHRCSITFAALSIPRLLRSPDMADAILTQKRLRELVSYCPDTGIFHDSISGKQISGYDSKGYRRLWLDGRNYMMHRLAWLYVYGRWPRAMIDHINGDPRDNRIVNLRDVTNAVNQQNQR